MKIRLIGAVIWLALFAAALLLIRDENKHTARPLLIHAASPFCDVPRFRPPVTPLTPAPPYSRRGDVA